MSVSRLNPLIFDTPKNYFIAYVSLLEYVINFF